VAGTGASAATPTNAGTSTAGAGVGTVGTTGTGDAARQTAGTGATGMGGAAGAAGTGAGAGSGPDAAWRRILHDGVVPGTQLAPASPAVAGGAVQQAAGEILTAVERARGDANQVALLFRPDPTIWDGRFFSNNWLQELPKPLSKLTWDNALYLSPRTAERLKVTVQDVVELTWKGRKVEAAVWIQPGQADNTGLLTLGYGRQKAGVASGSGTNAYALRTSDALWTVPAVGIRKLDKTYVLASTQNHHLLAPSTEEFKTAYEEAQQRHVVLTSTLEELRQDPQVIRKHRHVPAAGDSMYPNWKYDAHEWGMAIDQSVCTGCSSCVIACQAENNVPVVGKEQVLAGREMHWLRVDRYFEGSMDEPRYHHQPLPCMHCENAPCEVVCPVAATVHSDEGLNDMVYNRCVGTRYCSNNCPYKVRRFNFFRYSDKDTPVLAMLYNPDVTVRMRGVMEKCTYCVQRIEQAKIDSKVEGQPIPANRLQTACQQACPTQAIVFGDIKDEAWEVAQWRKDPLSYGLLEELNTRPRTTYMAKLRNPNPALEPAQPAGSERTTDGHS
jgi:molybdopterin-containing oxidoreductase family iron-sulfur binding subunit